eukprot:470107_1
MAQRQASNSQLNNEIISLLKVDNKGWNVALFTDKITNFLCENCDLVCCDAVELGCDHEDDDICSHCKECLNQLIKENNGKCPIDGHDNPEIFPVRSMRRQISKSIVICPYSKQYMQKVKYKNNQIIDTADNDEKEGIIAPENNNQNNNIKGCQFEGTLKDLIEKHLSKCVQKYNASFTHIITIQALKTEIRKLNAIIDRQKQEIENQKNKYILSLNTQNETNKSRIKAEFEQKWQRLELESKKDENERRVIHFKKYGLTRSNKADCLIGYDDIDGIKRAEIGCPKGHAMTAETMYVYIVSCIERNVKVVTIACPLCKIGLNWDMCTQIADMNSKEYAKWTRIIKGRLRGDIRTCPHCKSECKRKQVPLYSGYTYVFRTNCDTCNGHGFCWNCLQRWKGSGQQFCSNGNCPLIKDINKHLQESPLFTL